ncbi:MAG TPA: cytoplasmic protein [Lactobacillus sp.]|nr:cytoplasmic protein [Lactobacillus sp.]
MAKILLAGESWISSLTEYKGYDSFSSTKLESGCEDLLKALRDLGHSVTHLYAHDVPEKFPWTLDELDQYDVVILSDIGANSFNLSDGVFAGGNPTTDRLQLLKEWVTNGGALMMAGGYLSFGGFEGKAHYHNTPVEQVLPVDVSPYDDRIETPAGAVPQEVVTNGISQNLGDFPKILGYQDLTPKKDSKVLMTVDSHPFLVTRKVGQGRTLAYATDIAPHWASQAFMNWEYYGEFFSRCMKWLAGDLN